MQCSAEEFLRVVKDQIEERGVAIIVPDKKVNNLEED